MNKAREFDQSVVTELKALLGERVTTSASVREHHGKDESYFPYALPDAVVYPHSTEEVRDVVNICRRHGVPMIPFGVGTSLEGHVLAIEGGVTIDLSQMSSVLAVHEEDLDAVVQAGVTRKQLNEYIKHTGLFFPIDPGADATIGGMASTRASGTNAVRYGTMRENVLSLTVVLGLLIALLLNRAIRGIRLLRSLSILPMFAAPVALGYLGLTIFYEQGGPINNILSAIGFGSVPWLSSPKWALVSVLLVDAWQWTPFVFLVMLAALQSVPPELYEVATLDTRSGFKIFARITLPLIRAPLGTAAILRFVEAFKVFDIP